MSQEQAGTESEEQNQLYRVTYKTAVVEAKTKAEADRFGVERMRDGLVGVDDVEEIEE